MAPRSATASARSPKGGQGKRGGSTVTQQPAHQSVLTWLSLAGAMLAIGSSLYQGVWAMASLENRTMRNTEEIARNFKEDEYHRERHVKAVERIESNISGLTQVHVKIGQMETQLTNITEILKDLRTQMHHRESPGRAKGN